MADKPPPPGFGDFEKQDEKPRRRSIFADLMEDDLTDAKADLPPAPVASEAVDQPAESDDQPDLFLAAAPSPPAADVQFDDGTEHIDAGAKVEAAAAQGDLSPPSLEGDEKPEGTKTQRDEPLEPRPPAVDVRSIPAQSAAMSAPADVLTILHSVSQKHAAKQIRRHPTTGKVTNKSYGNEKYFRVEERPVSTFAELCHTLASLTKLPFAFPIRGAPLPGINRHHSRRLLHPHEGDPATFQEVPRRWFLVDVDHVPAPALTDPVRDPEGAVEYLIGLLPPELADISCWWQWSSSQSLPIPTAQDTLSLHLWYLSSVPLTEAQLMRWTLTHNLAAGTKLIDPAAHRTVQALYTAAPLFTGIPDPLPRRCGIRRGLEDEAVLVIPPADPRNPELPSGKGYEPGLGVAAYLAKIAGGKEGVRQPILSAIGSYIAIHGSNADCEPLKKTIRDAVDAADLHGYSDETLRRYKSDKHLDEIIAWVRQKHGDQPPRPLPPPPPPDPVSTTYDELIDTLNAHYAIANEAGKAIIFEQVMDPVRQRLMLTRISFEDFRKLYLNRSLTVEIDSEKKDDDGKKIMKKITRTYADWWLSSARRRQYIRGVIFDPKNAAPPEFWNLWTGFAVEPKPGQWDLMQDHIHRVICAGDEALTAYVLDFIARMFQHPDQPGDVALVLRGKRGSGKGIFLNWLWRAWGQHGCHISNARHLTGNFNAHLRDCVMLFADEAFFAGDRAGEGVLKALITEPSLPIEGKYQNLVEVPNMLHVFMSSNADWVVPAAVDERRFCVADVADNRVGDRAYFAALTQQMKNGGLAALIHDMLRRDIRKFEVRDVPMTAALRAQKTLSLGSIERWWLAVLSRAFIWKSRHGAPWFTAWHEFYSTELLWRSYIQWCDEARPYDRKRREQIGRFFADTYSPERPRGERPIYEIDSIDRRAGEVVEDDLGRTITVPSNLDEIAIVKQNRPYGYRVGELHEARARFLDLNNVGAEWLDVPDL